MASPARRSHPLGARGTIKPLYRRPVRLKRRVQIALRIVLVLVIWGMTVNLFTAVHELIEALGL
jgi:hypothetical protein